ncbi:MAG: hypothetical protein AAF585_12450 [Verrucomicrobiota bacterium]
MRIAAPYFFTGLLLLGIYVALAFVPFEIPFVLNAIVAGAGAAMIVFAVYLLIRSTNKMRYLIFKDGDLIHALEMTGTQVVWRTPLKEIEKVDAKDADDGQGGWLLLTLKDGSEHMLDIFFQDEEEASYAFYLLDEIDAADGPR